jgi:ABC-type antimicrobial peptide transport system permease subunit
MIVIENLLLFSAGVVVGIPLSILATKWAIWYTTKDLMYLDIQAGPEVYVITIVIALLSTLIASYISAMHITKLKLADTIREKLIT